MTDLEKGKSLFEKQEFEKAIEILTTFLNQEKNNADALYTRAICYRKVEEYDNSINDLTAILNRLPNEPTLLCDRGISHFKNKNIEAALKDMDQAVELEPNNPYRYSSRAYIKAKTDIHSAMADYEKAIELDPKDEISHNNLGLLQENAGRMKAAKKSFKKSNNIIGYDPDSRKDKIDTRENTQENIVNETQNEKPQERQSSLGKVILSVFTTKNGLKEYLQFIKSIFKQNT